MSEIIENKRNAKPERRKARMSLDAAADKSEVYNKQNGMHYIWVRDYGVNIGRYLKAGYEFVLQKDPERPAEGDVTGTSGDVNGRYSKIGDRSGTILFLMRIPQEYWEEDQKERDRETTRPLAEIQGTKGAVDDPHFSVKSFNVSQSIVKTKED